MTSKGNPVLSTLLGLATGDALGVPVEFLPRSALTANPVTGMRAFGTHHQMAGTWSDDSSMAFCLADCLCKGYNLKDIADTFVLWYNHNLWTARGRVFDIGNATSASLHLVAKGRDPLLSGGTGENSNGNGSLMRTLPLIFYTRHLPMQQRWQVTREVSGITHAHIRSELACFICCEYALNLLDGAEGIPAEWLEVLARRDDIIALAEKLWKRTASLPG